MGRLSVQRATLRRARRLAVAPVVLLTILAACGTTPPTDVEDICAIFEEKSRWYRAAQKSEERWGTPIHVQLAIIRQESTFEFDARPERDRLLGFIPWKRPSSAYGYAQALDSTWAWYQDETGRHGADRDDFADAIDFVGWYTHLSQRVAGISKWDPYNQYLAYHEGHTGWRRGSYRAKPGLRRIAKTVDNRAKEWGAQLSRCEEDLDDGWWPF